MPGPIPKPQMRGLLASWTKTHVPVLLLGAVSVGVCHWYFVGQRRRKAYAEFYQNYDADFHFKDMVSLGVFKSYKPDGTLNKKYLKELGLDNSWLQPVNLDDCN